MSAEVYKVSCQASLCFPNQIETFGLWSHYDTFCAVTELVDSCAFEASAVYKFLAASLKGAACTMYYVHKHVSLLSHCMHFTYMF